MQKLNRLHQCTKLYSWTNLAISSLVPIVRLGYVRTLFSDLKCPETRELVDYLDSLNNYEKSGVPDNAGTDTDNGFDLGRMRHLMDRLGNPQSKYKVVHVAGTKGKGSTAAFLSNILREEGYSVGCYSSPHIETIRERMSLGRLGEPVSANELCSLFHRIKKILDQAVEDEQGRLTHFEVLTAIAFTLFADQKVNIAVIEAGLGGARDATNIISSSGLAAAIITTIGKEHLAALGGSLESIASAKAGIIKHGRPVILGGPFLPHIEQIIRDKASSMSSPIVSASDSGNRSLIKDLSIVNGEPRQSCDIIIKIEKDTPLSIELLDANLSMLGYHQLQNAMTATCTAMCLRDQGWSISEGSIRAALENTQLLGRSQFLKKYETETLGLWGSMALLDGAHTQESAKALANTISVACPCSKSVLVVAMASDKDHIGFARELLSGLQLEAVFLTEVDIAGDKSRTASASLLKDSWTKASIELGIEFTRADDPQSLDVSLSSAKMIVTAERSLRNSLRAAHWVLKARGGNQSGVIVVTGSLHIVSAVLAFLRG